MGKKKTAPKFPQRQQSLPVAQMTLGAVKSVSMKAAKAVLSRCARITFYLHEQFLLKPVESIIGFQWSCTEAALH